MKNRKYLLWFRSTTGQRIEVGIYYAKTTAQCRAAIDELLPGWRDEGWEFHATRYERVGELK